MEKDTKNYLIKRLNINSNNMEIINWERLGETKDKWLLGKKIWMAKHISGFSTTAKVMYRRNKWPHSQCLGASTHKKTVNMYYDAKEHQHNKPGID